MNNIDGFSSWTVGGGTEDQSLPADISNFQASVVKGAVQLSWFVENEIENQGFIIQRSCYSAEDSLDRIIGHFSQDTALCGYGSSSESWQMEWQDTEIIAGNRYKYILKSQSYAGIIYTEATTEIDIPIREFPAPIPENFAVQPLFPNPFNAGTIIDYALSEDAHVVMVVYDLRGRQAAILKNQVEPAGYYQFRWNPGHSIGSGVYFLVFRAGEYRYSQKLTILK